MAKISAIFSDVGGVLGTNGWDRKARQKAAKKFGLDWDDFEGRHELVVSALEVGRMTLDEYLDHTIFCRPCRFSREEFAAFMKEQSQPHPSSLALFQKLASSGRYFLTTLNNESLDLNLYRIQSFGLKRCFSLFVSSCFVGVKKPDAAIYQMALRLTQRAPEECLFIDDRALNVEAARHCGMNALQCLNPAKLEQQIGEVGLTW
ncbi:MAG: HAD family hydrolase [Terriglobia bacterium]